MTDHGEREISKQARFQELIGAHAQTLEAIARKLCREPSLAADLVQDTLERAWRHLESLQDEARARSWLLRIQRNTWFDQLRRRRAEVPIEDIHEPSIDATAEPSWWERVTGEDLRRAIAQLQEPYHSVAVLHDLDGHPYREVARRLAIPSATVATRLHRARVRIRALLQRELGADEAA